MGLREAVRGALPNEERRTNRFHEYKMATAASTARRRASERAHKRLRQKRSKISGRQPLRDPKYLAWIRTLPCIVCSLVEFWQESPTEAAHVGVRGLRQKSSDRATLPLCGYHHRIGLFSHHRAGKNFWTIWKLDKEKLIAELRERYEGEISCKS